VLYNANSYSKLGNLFERKLRSRGKVYPFLDLRSLLWQPVIFCEFFPKLQLSIIASKSYYFGVGGSVKQFEKYLGETGTFTWQTVWKTEEGTVNA
jgi:hypothetical protein